MPAHEKRTYQLLGPSGSVRARRKNIAQKNIYLRTKKTFAIFGSCRSVRAQDSKPGIEFAYP